MDAKLKRTQRQRRHRRVRRRIVGTPERPRLAVFRSNRHIYAQAIDDASGRTLVAASSFEVKGEGAKAGAAKRVGALLGQRARERGIAAVVFDRGGYLYHGRVRAVADGAREAGLEL